MDGSAILYAGLGAGLGGLIGGILSKRISSKNLKSVITVLPVIFGYQGTVTLYKNMKLPRIFPMEESIIDAENPAFKILKDNNPSEYKELITLLDAPTRRGTLNQEHLDEFRTKFANLIAKKRRLAPAELLRKQNALSAEQFRVLRVKALEICTAQANGRSFPVLTGILGKEYQAKEQKLMARLFSVKASDYKVDAKLGEQVYSEILATNINDLGINTLDPTGEVAERVTSEHQLICKLFENSMADVNLLDDDGVRNVAAYISDYSSAN